MPRIRYLKPEFFDDEELCQLKPLARLMFAGLWCWADREGRLKDQPTRLKNTILGYDNCDADKLLVSLAEAEMIVRYEIEGEKYIQIRHFLRHQRPHTREVPSTYPAPTQPYLGIHEACEAADTGLGDALSQPQARHEPPEQIREQIQIGEQERQPPPLRETDPAVARAFTAYENLAGLAPKTVADAIIEALDDGVLPRWIEAACEEAALNNARNWKYVSAILKRWGRDGFKADRRGHGNRPDDGETGRIAAEMSAAADRGR